MPRLSQMRWHIIRNFRFLFGFRITHYTHYLYPFIFLRYGSGFVNNGAIDLLGTQYEHISQKRELILNLLQNRLCL
jgi:hypothetical protein